MAATALTTAQAANGVGTGGAVQLTGNFGVSAAGNMGGGRLDLERAANNVEAEYASCGIAAQFFGPGHASIINDGTNWYRAKLYNGNGAASAQMTAVQ